MLLLLHVAELAGHVLEELLKLGPNRGHDGEDLLLDRLADVTVFEVVEEVAGGVQVVEVLVLLAHVQDHIVQIVDQLDERNKRQRVVE